MFIRQSIRDFSDITLKQINDNFSYIWLKVFGNIQTGDIVDGAIDENKLSDGAVSQNKLGDYSVSQIKLVDGAVSQDKLGADVVEILNNTVDSVTYTQQIDSINKSLVTKVEEGDVKTIISQSPTEVRFAVGTINEVISNLVEINDVHLRATFADGSYSEMTSQGFKWHNNTTARDYHYLTYVASCVTTSDINSPVWINLPAEFIGKNWEAYTSIYDSYNSGGTTRAVQKLIAYTHTNDYANNRVGIVGYCNEIDTSTQAITQNGVGVRVFIIA